MPRSIEQHQRLLPDPLSLFDLEIHKARTPFVFLTATPIEVTHLDALSQASGECLDHHLISLFPSRFYPCRAKVGRIHGLKVFGVHEKGSEGFRIDTDVGRGKVSENLEVHASQTGFIFEKVASATYDDLQIEQQMA